MKTIFNIIISAFALFGTMSANAADPNWTAPTASNYQFSMNVTGVFVQSCSFANNTANKVAAFVGTELRGTAAFSVVDGSNALAFLTIYSNQSSGETVTFKVYNQSTDAVVDVPVQISFTENAFQGSLQTPFQFYTTSAVTTNFTATRVQNDYSLAASSSCDNGSATYTYQLVSGSGSNDNAQFTVQGNLLKRTGSSTSTTFSVRVKATSSSGLSFEKSFALTYYNTGIDNISTLNSTSISVYPNPLSGNKLFIELPNVKIQSVRMMDVNGKVVSTQELNNNTFDVSLSKGIYFVEITTEENVFYKKLIKE